MPSLSTPAADPSTSDSTPTELDSLLTQAAQLGQTGQPVAAATLCQQVLQQYPDSAQAWHLLGLSVLQQGQPQNALNHIKQAIALDPSIPIFHTHAGVAHCSLGELEQGITCYQNALALQPQAVEARYNLAIALQKLNRLDEARSAYFQVLVQQPQHVMAHYQLGKLCQQQQQTAEAIAHYQQALALDPHFMPAQTAIKSLRPVVASAPVPTPPTPDTITCIADDGFQSWLSQAAGSIAISTYQAGKLALVGWNGQQVSLLLRQFDKPMGMAVQGNRFALATRHQVLLFANSPVLAHAYLEDQPGRYDALYLPRAAYFTGDLNVHDLAWGEEDLWLVNTRFSCLSSLSSDFSFVPRWQPSFISEVVPEDRCHLNGLAMVEGQPRYVTALGATDTVGGWREHKATGGILIDVPSHEIILHGLSMPHSPCWHNGKLWLLNSGAGELLQVDPQSGEARVVCTLPGFLRGLCCVGSYALIGLCQIREQHIFGGLPVQERFEQLLCGVAVIDLNSGERVGLLELPQGCQELYGVQFLPQVLRPTILNIEKNETRQAFTAPDIAYWLRPSSEITA
ncbi:TIGR03032 family protein [Leptolyngbya sp. PL-A3]|uniref:TIGR03032 family protein n=1 Tax=Leptolyngbya sp. PL-A3 TaxID=2933911 RepID=UPI0032992572